MWSLDSSPATMPLLQPPSRGRTLQPPCPLEGRIKPGSSHCKYSAPIKHLQWGVQNDSCLCVLAIDILPPGIRYRFPLRIHLTGSFYILPGDGNKHHRKHFVHLNDLNQDSTQRLFWRHLQMPSSGAFLNQRTSIQYVWIHIGRMFQLIQRHSFRQEFDKQ